MATRGLGPAARAATSPGARPEFPAVVETVAGEAGNQRGDSREGGKNVSRPEEYDVLVLGSGRARFLAWSLAARGKRVAVVERRNLAGSCPTVACAPSKYVIHGAKVASYFRRGAEFGIAAGGWEVEMPAVRAGKRKMVDGIVARNVDAYRESGAALVEGQGRFVGPRTIEVAAGGRTRTLRGEVVVVGTGSRARMDPIPGLAEARPMTHVEALELDRVPKHLLVLGGGYVGLELAQALRRFGSRVTVIERNGALAHREDRDVSEALRELFEAEGIAVRTATPVARVEGRSGESVRLHAPQGVIEGSDLLVAGGRTPNTDGIGLEAAGIERDDRGFVKVDERLRTTAAGVWAVGDCAGSPHFTHVADDDVRVVRDNLAGVDRTTTGRLVPYCLFTDPELARVGLSESEARSRGVDYRLAKIPVAAFIRPWTLSEPRGFYKALVAADGDRILGFTAFAPEAGAVMTVVQTAMTAGLPYTALRDAILVHPTMAEGLAALFRAVPARP
jgi:pyruvate/2-oxoglutarate dehydrogenase complex dihydrolipoamide dehydrogenase (E3) component